MSQVIRPDRRRLLIGGAGVAAGLFAPAILRAGQSPDVDPFPMGVASGDPSPDGFVIWTRLALDPLAPDGQGGMTAPVPVRWEIARDEAMRQTAARGEFTADSRLAHAVHVEATGLEPGRPYWYRFTAMGAQSPIGRTRTAPRPGARLDRLRCVVSSCAHYELGYFSAYRHMAAEDPDLILMLGDYIYEYSYRGNRAARALRMHDRDADITDLPGFRNRYAQYHADPDLKALHATAPCLVTWDDHEVQNDYSNRWAFDPAIAEADFLKIRSAGYQAFYEHMPLRRTSAPNQTGMRIHRRLRFGDLAEINLLDGRQYRTPTPCATPTSRRGRVVPAGSCAEQDDPAATMLGLDQERWLYDGLKQSSARWTLIAQDLMVAPTVQNAAGDVPGRYTGGWDGYAANRTRMLQAVADSRARNPVVLSGDIHTFWATDLKADFARPESATVATEFVTTAVTQDPPGGNAFNNVAARNAHVRFFDNTVRGYIGFELTPKRLDVRFQAISDRRDPAATVSTMKRFVVEDGKTGASAA